MGLQLTSVADKAKKVGANFDLAAKLSQASEAVSRFSDAAKTAVAAPANEFIEFEHQMSKVAAVGDLTGTAFERMKKQALDLGAATRYSSTEAAKAQENLVSAGYDVNEIMSLTPAALKLATAGDLELARASQILSGTLKGFSKDATQAGNVIDVLASASAVSAADVEYLAEIFTKAGPVAKTLGVDLETVAASGAALAEAQIGAAEGGTALRTVMLRLSAPAKAARDAFKSLGFGKTQMAELQAQLGKGDLPGVLKKIGQSFDKMGLSAVERVEKMKHIFGDEAVAQASVLVDAAMKPTADTKGLFALEQAFRKVDGAATKMATRMDADTAGSLERLSSSWSGFLMQMGEKMGPAINQMSEGMQKNIATVGDWVEKNPELAAQLGRMSILAVGGTIALKGLLITMSVAASAWGLASTAIGVFSGAVGALNAVLIPTVGVLAPAAIGVASFTAATVAMGAAAFAVGYGIGTVADKIFGLSDKLANAMGWVTGAITDHDDSAGGKNRQEYADGTVIDGKTGKVIELGTGPADAAPRIVRQARASGASTVDEVNEFVATAKKDVKVPLMDRPGLPIASGAAPVARKGIPAALAEDGADKVVAAIKENTAVNHALLEEQRRKRPRLGSPGSGAGQGAF